MLCPLEDVKLETCPSQTRAIWRRTKSEPESCRTHSYSLALMVAGNKKATFNIAPRVIGRDMLKGTMRRGRSPSLTKAHDDLCGMQVGPKLQSAWQANRALCCEEPHNRADSRKLCTVSITRERPSATVQEVKLEACSNHRDVIWEH